MLQVHQNLFVLFRLVQNRSKNGKAVIYLRFTLNGKRVELSTHQYVDIKLWDAEVQCVKGKTDEAKNINNQLASMKSNLYKHYNYLLALEKPISGEILKECLCRNWAKAKNTTRCFFFLHWPLSGKGKNW